MTQIIESLAVELSLEAQNFSKQMSAIDKAVRNLDTQFKNAKKGVDDYEKTYVGLDNKINTTAKKIELYNTKLQKQKKNIQI